MREKIGHHNSHFRCYIHPTYYIIAFRWFECRIRMSCFWSKWKYFMIHCIIQYDSFGKIRIRSYINRCFRILIEYWTFQKGHDIFREQERSIFYKIRISITQSNMKSNATLNSYLWFYVIIVWIVWNESSSVGRILFKQNYRININFNRWIEIWKIECMLVNVKYNKHCFLFDILYNYWNLCANLINNVQEFAKYL